jgi:CheY-like chemotaxis protein
MKRAERLRARVSKMRTQPGIARPVLVIEDDYEQRNAILETLAGAGYRALGVSTLAEAQAELELTQPLLLVVDRRLPDGDGVAFVGRLRANPFTARLPVLALTAASGRHEVDDAFVAGCDGFLAKPASAEALLAAVERLTPPFTAPER